MIRSFRDAATRDIYNGENSKAARKLPSDILSTAQRKLDYINSAGALSDLRIPPGNRLEALKGDLLGFHCIRINDQWRIAFRWVDNGADDVQILDYH